VCVLSKMADGVILDVSDALVFTGFYYGINGTFRPGGSHCLQRGGGARSVVTAIYVWQRATASLELPGPITIHVSYCIVFV
jgi:hypothetical protein